MNRDELIKQLSSLKIHQSMSVKDELGKYASKEQLGDIADFILSLPWPEEKVGLDEKEVYKFLLNYNISCGDCDNSTGKCKECQKEYCKGLSEEICTRFSAVKNNLEKLDRNRLSHVVLTNIEIKMIDKELKVNLDVLVDAIISKFGTPQAVGLPERITHEVLVESEAYKRGFNECHDAFMRSLNKESL